MLFKMNKFLNVFHRTGYLRLLTSFINYKLELIIIIKDLFSKFQSSLQRYKNVKIYVDLVTLNFNNCVIYSF